MSQPLSMGLKTLIWIFGLFIAFLPIATVLTNAFSAPIDLQRTKEVGAMHGELRVLSASLLALAIIDSLESMFGVDKHVRPRLFLLVFLIFLLLFSQVIIGFIRYGSTFDSQLPAQQMATWSAMPASFSIRRIDADFVNVGVCAVQGFAVKILHIAFADTRRTPND